MKILSPVALCFIISLGQAQTLKKQIINCDGNATNANSITLRSSVGEPVVGKVGNKTMMLSQGFYTGSFQVINTAVNELANNNSSFSFYPNPTFDVVNFNNENLQATFIEVNNLLGQQIISQSISINQINLATLKAGIYFIKLFNNQHQLLTVSKIIKQ
jgi:hypothetical protein